MASNQIRSKINTINKDTIQALTYSLSKHSKTNIPKIAIATMISIKLNLPKLHGNSRINQTAAMMRVAASVLLLTFLVYFT